VTTALPRCPWAHFACHAASELDSPSASYLLLHDHRARPLTVVDVSRLRLDRAELAFLSACSTALPGAQLADEGIHLASAFQLAGYRYVVATLWPIDDLAAVGVATEIYESLATGGTARDSAEALHAASRRLRNSVPNPSTWAAHTHSGA
jgi:CHAT domain-containing protein